MHTYKKWKPHRNMVSYLTGIGQACSNIATVHLFSKYCGQNAHIITLFLRRKDGCMKRFRCSTRTFPFFRKGKFNCFENFSCLLKHIVHVENGAQFDEASPVCFLYVTCPQFLWPWVFYVHFSPNEDRGALLRRKYDWSIVLSQCIQSFDLLPGHSLFEDLRKLRCVSVCQCTSLWNDCILLFWRHLACCSGAYWT